MLPQIITNYYARNKIIVLSQLFKGNITQNLTVPKNVKTLNNMEIFFRIFQMSYFEILNVTLPIR